MRKTSIAFLLGMATIVLVGCSGSSENSEFSKTEQAQEEAVAVGSLNKCAEEKVAIEGYGDKGKRLKNCFVQYPGEPSRSDKSYYIVEDICGQFTKEFVENALGKKIVKLELPKIASLNNCTYYFDEKESVLLNLEYLSAENQKKGNEALGRKTEKSARIPMENLIVWQDEKMINVIYLVLGPEKFISLRPMSKKSFSTPDEFLNFASKMGEAIKKYK